MVEDPITGCWRWVGDMQNVGYAILNIPTGATLARRFSYAYFVRELEADERIYSTCKTKGICVNPTHLEARTSKKTYVDANLAARMAKEESEEE